MRGRNAGQDDERRSRRALQGEHAHHRPVGGPRTHPQDQARRAQGCPFPRRGLGRDERPDRPGESQGGAGWRQLNTRLRTARKRVG